MPKVHPNLTEFVYEGKSPLLKLADCINKKSVYPLFHGRKVVFSKDQNGHSDYKIYNYKYRCLTVLFFVITMPLLGLTMAIKSLSQENKLKFREIDNIANEKRERVEKYRKAIEDDLLQQEKKKEQDLQKDEHLKEAIKRVESPSIGHRRPSAENIPILEEKRPDEIEDKPAHIVIDIPPFCGEPSPLENDIDPTNDAEDNPSNVWKHIKTMTSSPTIRRLASFANSFWKWPSEPLSSIEIEV